MKEKHPPAAGATAGRRTARRPSPEAEARQELRKEATRPPAPGRDKPAPLKITGVEDASRLWREQVTTAPWYRGDTRLCVVAFTDARGHCTGLELLSTGTAERLEIEPSVLFRRALIAGAQGVVLLAVSGREGAWRGDEMLWQRLEESGAGLNISVHDLLTFHPFDAGRSPRSSRQSAVVHRGTPRAAELETDPLNISGVLLQHTAHMVADGLPVALAWTVAGYQRLHPEELPALMTRYQAWMPGELSAALARRYR